ncbi:hypothetical protein [Streptomyces sp. HNM0574]|uniref:hypothetical protein n=1 Tax=Streptomyces sp. HNM0574 TaxID=2714954 RepID=UPI00146D7CF7|nr:hypothetical protein [Streptomyces sp. HNM0574]NLU70703.1 hypothetical protein [Streptomyces sp. HNM0574]
MNHIEDLGWELKLFTEASGRGLSAMCGRSSTTSWTPRRSAPAFPRSPPPPLARVRDSRSAAV